MSLIDDIKRDREAGTPGRWVAESSPITSSINAPDAEKYTDIGYLSLGDHAGNARRIARVPDMEDALLAADRLADAYDELVDAYENSSPFMGEIGQDRLMAAERGIKQAAAAYREATK